MKNNYKERKDNEHGYEQKREGLFEGQPRSDYGVEQGTTEMIEIFHRRYETK